MRNLLDTGRATRPMAAGALAIAALLVTFAPSACSVVVDGSSEQCDTDDDCADLAGTLCQKHICTTPDTPCASNLDCAGVPGGACLESVCKANVNTCETTKECIDKNGENFICKRPVTGIRECVSLLNEDCTLVEGDATSEDAVFIGSVLPIADKNDDTGSSTQNGARLALNEIQGNAGGLPAVAGGAGRRPLVLVSCNDGSDKDQAVRAATYLVDTIGVQTIIGAAFSGISVAVANTVTIPNGVLLMSASATSVALSDLEDRDPACVAACNQDADCEGTCTGLFWRTSPNDEFQSAALAAYTAVLEDRVRAAVPLEETDDLKVIILHKGDSYGEGIASALQEQMKFNGASAASQQGTNFDRRNYGDPDDPDANPEDYGGAIAAAKSLEAHIIFVLGTDEGTQEIIKPLEEQWPELGLDYKPIYVLGDGGFTQALEALVDAQPTSAEQNDLRSRLRGSVPGTTADNNPLFSTFASSFQSKSYEGSPNTFGAAGGYDITYLMAFAMASVGSGPLTGTNIARGLTRTVPEGTEVRVGPTSLNTGFGIMANPSGGNIDFAGASGPLDFDVKKGEAASDVLIWCMKRTGNKNLRQPQSGLIFSAASLKLVGDEEEPGCN